MRGLSLFKQFRGSVPCWRATNITNIPSLRLWKDGLGWYRIHNAPSLQRNNSAGVLLLCVFVMSNGGCVMNTIEQEMLWGRNTIYTSVQCNGIIFFKKYFFIMPFNNSSVDADMIICWVHRPRSKELELYSLAQAVYSEWWICRHSVSFPSSFPIQVIYPLGTVPMHSFLL